MVKAALALARHWQISQTVTGVVVLAVITSLPNAFTAVRLGLAGRGEALVTETLASNTINLTGGVLLPALFVTVAGSGARRSLRLRLARRDDAPHPRPARPSRRARPRRRRAPRRRLRGLRRDPDHGRIDQQAKRLHSGAMALFRRNTGRRPFRPSRPGGPTRASCGGSGGRSCASREETAPRPRRAHRRDVPPRRLARRPPARALRRGDRDRRPARRDRRAPARQRGHAALHLRRTGPARLPLLPELRPAAGRRGRRSAGSRTRSIEPADRG